jgi:hypothetical protein
LALTGLLFLGGLIRAQAKLSLTPRGETSRKP